MTRASPLTLVSTRGRYEAPSPGGVTRARRCVGDLRLTGSRCTPTGAWVIWPSLPAVVGDLLDHGGPRSVATVIR